MLMDSIHEWPHPFEQHFSNSSQLSSVLQSSEHVPITLSVVAGHTCFCIKIVSTEGSSTVSPAICSKWTSTLTSYTKLRYMYIHVYVHVYEKPFWYIWTMYQFINTHTHTHIVIYTHIVHTVHVHTCIIYQCFL